MSVATATGGSTYLLSCNAAGIALALGFVSAALSSGALLRLVPAWMPGQKVPFACLGIYFILFQLTAAIGRLATCTFIGKYDNKQPRSMNARVLAGTVNAPLRGWSLTARMHSAHLNTVEGLPIFLAGIYAAREMEMRPEWQASLAILVIICRILYIPLYASNLDLLRTVVWSTSFCASVLSVLLPLLPEGVGEYMTRDHVLVLVVGDTCE